MRVRKRANERLTNSPELCRRDLRRVVLLPCARRALRRRRVPPDLLLHPRREGVELLLGHHLVRVPAAQSAFRYSRTTRSLTLRTL